MLFAVLVEVSLRPGVADPQGPPSSARSRPSASTGSPGSGSARPSASESRPPTRPRRPRRGRGPVRPVPHQPGDRGQHRHAHGGRGRADARRSSASSSSRAPTASSTSSRPSPPSAASAELLWHGDARVDGVDAVVVPGRFAHGDYLRPGAIARFSPVWPRSPTSPPTAVRSSASATASRCSPRPGCCRARCRRTAGSSSSAPPWRCGSSRADRCSPAPSTVGAILRIPINHFEGNYTCRRGDARRAASTRTGSCSATSTTPMVGRRHRRRLQRGRQRGRPDAPPRAGLADAARLEPTACPCCASLLDAGAAVSA